jgi:hypothetical protein
MDDDKHEFENSVMGHSTWHQKCIAPKWTKRVSLICSM